MLKIEIHPGIADSGSSCDDHPYHSPFAMDWQEIITYSACLPHLEKQAQRLVDGFIGYLPLPMVYIRHEPFVRALIASFQSGNISEDVFLRETEFYTKMMRNDDMKKYGWARDDVFFDNNVEQYETNLSQYKQAARDRLSEFLDYEPSIEHSWDAEIYLRQVFTMDFYYKEMPYCLLDYRAVTIVKYREHLMLSSKEAADNSPLVGLLLCEQTGTSPLRFL